MLKLNPRNAPKFNQTALNVVSLFDGMSCGMLALKSAGVKVANYYAAEIDKHAMAVAKHNWQDAITHVGDVTLWDDWHKNEFPKIDLLIGGSPCQSFSMAGKRQGMATKNEEVITLDRYLELKAQGIEFEGQSYLFWEYVRILKHLHTQNPNMFFMLENVKMSKKWEDVISDTLGVAPVLINSARVSAQNRERLYWTNISFNRNIKDRGIFLTDILDEVVPDKQLHTTKSISYMNREQSPGRSRWNMGYWSDSAKQKSACVTANFCKGQPNNVLVDRRVDVKIYQFPRGNNKGGILNTDGKSPTVTSSRWEQNCKLVIGAREVGRKLDENGKRDDKNLNIKTVQQYEFREDFKSNCVTTVSKDSLLAFTQNFIEYIIRKFTVGEVCKLQTVPSEYLIDCIIGNRTVSNHQLYRMLGNGWTIEVIAIIFRGILNPSTNPDHAPQRPQIQQDLFSEVMA